MSPQRAKLIALKSLLEINQMNQKHLSGILSPTCGIVLFFILFITIFNVENAAPQPSFASGTNSKHTYFPAIFTPPIPRLDAAIGYTGAWDNASIGSNLFFPSFRKGDSGWGSTIAIQNISDQQTLLTLSFFNQDGTIAYTPEAIQLQPFGTYIALASKFRSLANGSYSVNASASEKIVGMVNTLNVTGTKAIAYNGANQGSEKILAPLIREGIFGITSRLCIQNTTDESANTELAFYDKFENLLLSRSYPINAYGHKCFDTDNESLLPEKFTGSALVTSQNHSVVVSVEEINATGNWAQGYLGFDVYDNTGINYIPLCQQTHNRHTNIIFENVGTQTTDVHVNHYDTKGLPTASYLLTPQSIYWGNTTCYNPSSNTPPFPFEPIFGSNIIETYQSEIISLVLESNSTNDEDEFSYRGLSGAAATVYVPNVGKGLNFWQGSLIIQNTSYYSNDIRLIFYDQSGQIIKEILDEIPPNGMTPYFGSSLPGIPTSYEGSAIISGTQPIAVLINKHR